ncbi:MAG TPA: PAS domain-containing protein [Opitutaceae bacterium]
MKKGAITPVDASRDFRVHEVFCSFTDRKGVILAGNEVFTRISGYAWAELSGQPHNIIRHPDMPRAVFQLFWEELHAGRPVAAYVKNLAKDGRYYWVLALACPVGDGYLSIRIKPSSALLPAVEALYRTMRVAERTEEERGSDGRTAMTAARQVLVQGLRSHGFDSYEAFMRTALLREELNSRDAALARERIELLPAIRATIAEKSPRAATVVPLHESGRQTYGRLTAVCARLDDLARLNAELSTHARTMLRLAGDFRVLSLNAGLNATKLGEEGRGLGVIASHLGTTSTEISGTVGTIGRCVETSSRQLGGVIFNLAWARVQFEMTVIHYGEMLAARDGDGACATRELATAGHLRSAFRATSGQALTALAALADELGNLDDLAEVLHKTVTSLQMAYISCKVEVSRVSHDLTLREVFGDIGLHVDKTREVLAAMTGVIEKLAQEARQAPAIAATVAETNTQLDRHGEALARIEQAEALPAAV